MRLIALFGLFLSSLSFSQTVPLEGGPTSVGEMPSVEGPAEAPSEAAETASQLDWTTPATVQRSLESIDPAESPLSAAAQNASHDETPLELAAPSAALRYAGSSLQKRLRSGTTRALPARRANDAHRGFVSHAEALNADAFEKLSAAAFQDNGSAVQVPESRPLHASPDLEDAKPAGQSPIAIVQGREAAGGDGGGKAPPSEKKPLGLFHLTLLGVNTIVGSGVYIMPGKMAGLLGPASIVPFALVGMLLVSVGLCFAEASTYFKRDGGAYLYAKAAFGDTAGYAIGWMGWVGSMFGWATIASAISGYLSVFIPAVSNPWLAKGVAVGAVAAVTALNIRGVKQGARTSSFFTAAKLIPLAAFVGLGLWAIFARGAGHFIPFAPHGWVGLGAAASMAYFAFQGFENVPVPAGNVDKPAKTVPKAVILSIAIAGVAYMAIQAVAVGSFPGLGTATKPLADAAGSLIGPTGSGLMALGAVISMVGAIAGVAMVAPNFLSSLAHDGQFPKGLAALHKKFGTPHRAILLTAGVVTSMILLLDFSKLVDFTNVVICAQYLAACLAVPFLRRKLAAPEGGFRLPGGWTIPLIGAAATLWLGSQGGLAQVWWAFGILGVGLAIRFFVRRRAA